MLQQSLIGAKVVVPAWLILGALTFGTPAADAASIHACVNKHTGSARIVSAKAKCRSTERRVTWNTAGPSGPRGQAGTPGGSGTPGTNGVGPDYASRVFAPAPLAEDETDTVIASRSIPPGSYLISGKTIVGGSAKSAVFVAVLCELIDSPGTPMVVELPIALDVGEWAGEFALEGTSYTAASTIDLQAQITTTQPTTLALGCVAGDGAKEATVDAFSAQVNALQTIANS
jgi:hypothetical protein